jgi:HPt (histidine-containing phosphotransfer) domain-containing protein
VDGRSLLDRATDRFVLDAPDLGSAVARAVEEGDADALEATAHKLRGSAGNLGLTRTAWLAQLLEESAEDGRTTEAADLVAALRQELAALLEGSSALLATPRR